MPQVASPPPALPTELPLASGSDASSYTGGSDSPAGSESTAGNASTGGGSTLSAGAIAGIAAGSVALLAAVAGLAVWLTSRRRTAAVVAQNASTFNPAFSPDSPKVSCCS